MKRRHPAKTSIVPLVVLQAACAGVASVTPACGETERNAGGASTTTVGTTGNPIGIGMGGSIIVLAVNGFGGPGVNGTGGIPGVSAAISGTATETTSTSSGTITAASIGAGGSIAVLAVAGFGGQPSTGGEAGALGEGGHAGANERELDPAGSNGHGNG